MLGTWTHKEARRLIAAAVGLLALLTALVWGGLHHQRVQRDQALAQVCVGHQGRPHAELSAAFARAGVQPRTTGPLLTTYTTLTSAVQSFGCVVITERGKVRRAHVVRITYQEANYAGPSLDAPAWVQSAWLMVVTPLVEMSAALTP